MQTGISTPVKALLEVGWGVPIQPYLSAKQRLWFLGQNYIVAGKQKHSVCNKPEKCNLCFHSSARLISGLHTKPRTLNISQLQLAISKGRVAARECWGTVCVCQS